MRFIGNSLAASAAALLLAAFAMPTQAQAQHVLGEFCEACNQFSGRCETHGSIRDRCHEGEYPSWHCAAWGCLMECCRYEPQAPGVGLDGTIVGSPGRLALSEVEALETSAESETRYYRDCQGRVVARVYSRETAALMREKTRNLTV
jgi:hypothetical protein